MKIWNGFFWDPENSKSDHLTEISEISKKMIFRIVVKNIIPRRTGWMSRDDDVTFKLPSQIPIYHATWVQFTVPNFKLPC